MATFLQQHPAVVLNAAHRFAKGLGGLATRVKLLLLGDTKGQVFSELVYLARHFGHSRGRRVVIDHDFTHQQIADLTGLARETVSRILEDATRRGLLGRRRHHLIINDLTALEKEIPV